SVADGGGRGAWSARGGRLVGFVGQTKFEANAPDGDQVYVRDLQAGTILRVSTPATGIGGGSTTDRGGSAPVISGDGHFVAFVSRTKFDPNAADVDQIYRRCVENGAVVGGNRPAASLSGGPVVDEGGGGASGSRCRRVVGVVCRSLTDVKSAVRHFDFRTDV